MYKVFVNNSVIYLSSQANISSDYNSFHVNEVNLFSLFLDLELYPEKKFHLYHETNEKVLEAFFTKLPVIVAGGGKVYNEQAEILFIKRNGKWDLPKGKIEKGEVLEDCALREVEEETGIQGLEITRFLKQTMHVFKRDGEYRLKLTYWFEMFSAYSGDFTPQLEEDIEKVKWKNFKNSKKALKNTYSAIHELFPGEYYI